MEMTPTRQQGEAAFFAGRARGTLGGGSWPNTPHAPNPSSGPGGNFGEEFRTDGDYVRVHLDDAPLPPQDHRCHIRLHFARQDWYLRPHLGDEAFASAPAAMALSPAFSCNFLLYDHLLSNQELASLGLSAHSAWELGARRMLAEIRTAQGYGFQHRSASFHTKAQTPGQQIRFPVSVPSSWLAHPRTFSLLDGHFREVLGEPVVFLSPEPGLLFAVPASSPREPWEQWLKSTYGNTEEFWALRATEGFPEGHLLTDSDGNPTGADDEFVAAKARTFETVIAQS